MCSVRVRNVNTRIKFKKKKQEKDLCISSFIGKLEKAILWFLKRSNNYKEILEYSCLNIWKGKHVCVLSLTRIFDKI